MTKVNILASIKFNANSELLEMLHTDGRDTTTLKSAFSIIFHGERKKKAAMVYTVAKRKRLEKFFALCNLQFTFTKQFHYILTPIIYRCLRKTTTNNYPLLNVDANRISSPMTYMKLQYAFIRVTKHKPRYSVTVSSALFAAVH